MTYGASNTNNFPKQSGITLEDKAQRFGQSATDSLLVCVPKDWSRVKKKMQHSQLQQLSYTEILRN